MDFERNIQISSFKFIVNVISGSKKSIIFLVFLENNFPNSLVTSVFTLSIPFSLYLERI